MHTCRGRAELLLLLLLLLLPAVLEVVAAAIPGAGAAIAEDVWGAAWPLPLPWP